MNIAFAARIICDISLWYCGAGLILSLFGAASNALVPAVMVLCCVLCDALSRRKPSYRFIPLPILAVTLLFIRSVPDALLNLPPLLYCIRLCCRSDFYPDYESSRGYYKAAAISLLAATFVFFAISGSHSADGVIKYLLIFLFSGVLMLRLLRHNEQNRREWRLQVIDLTLLLLCCAAALFLSSGVFLGAAGKALLFLYKIFIMPLLLGLAYALSFLFLLLSKLIVIKCPRGSVPKINSENLNLAEILGPDFADEASKSNLLGQLLAALGIILFIFLAFLIFRRLSKGIGKRTGNPAEYKSSKKAVAEISSPLIALAPRTPREAVRHYYRRFLQNLLSRGHTLRPGDTSESILRAAREFYDPSLVFELREIYVKARYSPDPITKADSRRAKEISRNLKSEHKKETSL